MVGPKSLCYEVTPGWLLDSYAKEMTQDGVKSFHKDQQGEQKVDTLSYVISD